MNNTACDPLSAATAGLGGMLSTIPYSVPLLPRLNSTLLSAITPTSPSYPFYHNSNPRIFSFISDHWLALASPIIVYWVLSLAFHALDVAQIPYFESKRIHESPEVLSRNKATVMQVVKAVVLQQVIQTILGYFWMDAEPSQNEMWNDDLQEMAKLSGVVGQAVVLVLGDRTGQSLLTKHGKDIVSWTYWWGIPLAQFYAAFLIMDTWQYFLHRAFHTSRFLYRHFHSVHHRLYVPFAFGALYNHPVEGLVLDSLGAVVAETLSGMSTRQAALLFALSSAKTVDDHCGYRLWWDPCQFLFHNNVDYHDIHHQSYGIKKNFSQPFFTNWDNLLGTKMTREQAQNRFKKSAQTGSKSKTTPVLKVSKID